DVVAKKAKEVGVRVRLYVKLDMGMGCFGMKDIDEVTRVVECVVGEVSLLLAGVMTHFAMADEPNSDFFNEQLRRFQPLAEQMKRHYLDCVVHVANSAALYRDEHAYFDMAWCGIAVYGFDFFYCDPFERRLESAFAFEFYVVDVKLIQTNNTT